MNNNQEVSRENFLDAIETVRKYLKRIKEDEDVLLKIVKGDYSNTRHIDSPNQCSDEFSPTLTVGDLMYNKGHLVSARLRNLIRSCDEVLGGEEGLIVNITSDHLTNFQKKRTVGAITI